MILKVISRRIFMLAFVTLLSVFIHAGTASAFLSPSEYYNKFKSGSGTTVTSPPAGEESDGQANPNPDSQKETQPATPDSNPNTSSPGGTVASPSSSQSGSNTTWSDYYSRIINNRTWYNPGYSNPGTIDPGNNTFTPGSNTGTKTPDNNTTPDGGTGTTPPPVDNTTPGGNTGTTPPPGTNPGDTGSMSASEKQMLDLVNQERAKTGLPAFKVDSRLVDLARMKSKDMYENNYFDHNSPTYGSPYNMVKNAGINYRVMGAENIAKAATVTRAHDLLMNSDGHRANILDSRHDTIGIGIVSASGCVYITQLFAGN